MDPILLAVLAGFLITHTIESLLSIVNLKHAAALGDSVPAAFQGFVSGPELGRIRAYTAANGRLGLIESQFDDAAVLLFLFTGLLDRYNNWIAGLNLPPVAAALVFLLPLVSVQTALGLPFSLYRTFRIEERFGFNTQNLGGWLVDLGKGLILTTLLGGLLAAGIFGLIAWLPHRWWLAVWLLVVSFSLFVHLIAPVVIAPLFNKFTPLADLRLEERIKELMERAGLSVSRVFTMDASKRSRHSNAYFSGLGRTKRIVLFDTLLESIPAAGILAILAHEAGHWRQRHILKRLALSHGIALVLIYAAFRLIADNRLARLFDLAVPTPYAQLLLAGFLGSIALFPLKPLLAAFSRRHERQADDFAVALTGDPAPLAEALRSLGLDNLANLNPHPWYAAFHYSHPPLAARIERLLGLLPTGRKP